MAPTINKKTYTLNNGITIPAVGFGCMTLTVDQIVEALRLGYRLLDTAAIYGKGQNEITVGQAIKESGVPREEITVVTKLWNTDHKISKQALDASLERLGLDYVDVYLIHHPFSEEADGKHYKDWDIVDTYRELNKLVKSTDKIRSIGVSNFTKEDIERLKADPEIDVLPVLNQIEAHPLLTQPELKEYLDKEHILIQAYRPLGGTGAALVENEDIVKLAEKYKINPSQVLLSWAVQRNTNIIPRTKNYDRMALNLRTVELEDQDFEALNHLSDKYGVKRFNHVWKKLPNFEGETVDF